MSHPLGTTKWALARKYSAVKAKVAELEQLLLELNRHPDVTPDMLLEAQQSYQRISARLRTLRSQLLAKGVLHHEFNRQR
jgi:hypothetical protein